MLKHLFWTALLLVTGLAPSASGAQEGTSPEQPAPAVAAPAEPGTQAPGERRERRRRVEGQRPDGQPRRRSRPRRRPRPATPPASEQRPAGEPAPAVPAAEPAPPADAADGNAPAPAPPAGDPPAGTPPAGTSPAGTPPAGSAPPPGAIPEAPAPPAEGAPAPAPTPPGAPLPAAPAAAPEPAAPAQRNTPAPDPAPEAAPRRSATPAAPGRSQAEPAARLAAAPRTEARPRVPAPPLLSRGPDWDQVFHRTPLGLTRATPGRAYAEARGALDSLVRSPGNVLSAGGGLGWGWWLALALLAAGIIAGLVTERLCPRWWRRPWLRGRLAAARYRSVGWVVGLARSLALPAAVLLLWTLGGMLFREALRDGLAEPFSLVQDLLSAWLASRALHAAARQVIPEKPAEAAASRLYGSFHRLVLLATLWWGGMRVLGWAAPDSETFRLWVTAGHLCLVLGAFALLVRKQAILSLLPDLESRAYHGFRRLLAAVYLPLVYFSLIIAVLWVVGYQALASTFLARSWAIIGVLIAAFVAFHWLRDLPRRGMDESDSLRPAAGRMLAASDQLLAVSITFLTIAAAFSILGLWPVWLYLLDQDWINIGKTRIAGEAIWASIGLVVAILVLSRFVQAILEYRVYPAVGVGAGEAYAFNRLLHYTLVAAAVLLVLNNLGLSAENLALVAGGLSVGVGLGLQDVAKNIAGGIILLTTRQVRQGDVISVAGEMGTVREVNLRATVVTTGDNVDLLVPNSRLLEETVVNWTHSSSVVRAKVAFGVSYDADPQRVMALALEVARQHPEVLAEPAPEVWLLRMGDSSLDFELQAWVDIRRSVRPRVTTGLYVELLSRLKAEGIEVPFPQRDVHLRSGIPWEDLLAALSPHAGQGAASQKKSGTG